VITLTTNRRASRPDQQWERDALSAPGRQCGPAIQAYLDHGRVTISTDIARLASADRRLVEGPPRAVDGHHGRPPGRRGRTQRAGPGPPPGRRENWARNTSSGDKTFAAGDRVIFERNQRVRAAGELRRTGSSRAGPDPERHLRHRGGGDPANRRHPDIQTPRPGRVTFRVTAKGLFNQRSSDSGLIVTLDAASGCAAKSVRRTSTNLGYALTVFRFPRGSP